MIIELTKEFVGEVLKETDELKKEKAIVVMNSAFSHMYHHHHVVCCNVGDVDELLKLRGLGIEAQLSLNWIKRKILDVNALKAKASCIVRPGYDDNQVVQVDGKEIFIVNVLKVDEIKESVIMCENESDARFYLNVFNWLNESAISSVSLSNVPYGGGGGEAILSVGKENKAIFVVADSDKDYNSASYGSTYKGVKEKVKEVKKTAVFPIELYAPNVREKENLFPYLQYKSAPSISGPKKKVLELLGEEMNEEILRFFDIKDGIKRKKLKDATWKGKYDFFLQKCIDAKIINDISTCSGCVDDCDAKGCEHKKEELLPGIKKEKGDILESVSKDFFKNSTKKTISDTDLDKFLGNQGFIIDEWASVADKMSSYGCCIKEGERFLT